MEQKEVIELSKEDIVKIIAKEYGVGIDDVRFGNHPYWVSATVIKSIKQDGDILALLKECETKHKKVYVVSYADDGCETHNFVFDDKYAASQCEGWCMGNFDSASLEECEVLHEYKREEFIKLTEDYFINNDDNSERIKN